MSLVLGAIAVPALLAGLDRARTLAAARHLAARMTLARAQAVTRGVYVALRFTDDNGVIVIRPYADGNGNGVRTKDITNGVDRPLEPASALRDLFPGVNIQAPPGGDAVQFGAGDLVSFAPIGTATSGSVYLQGRDGSRYAVRVLGATARTRVLHYDPARRDYVEMR